MTGLDVVITSYRTRDLLARCLDSLHRQPFPFPRRVVVVDNGSGDGSPELVRAQFPEVELIVFDHNRGYGAATNRALRDLKYEAVFLLNADAEATADCLPLLIGYLKDHPRVGAVGPRQIGHDQVEQVTCGDRPTFVSEALRWRRHRMSRQGDTNFAGGSAPAKAVSWISGSAMLIRREALRQTGLFDERFFLYFEDIDLCLRMAAAGWEIHYLPAAVVIHQRGASAASDPAAANYEYRRSQLLFWRKHAGRLARAAIRGWVGLRGLTELIACRCGLVEDGSGTLARHHQRILGLAWKGLP